MMKKVLSLILALALAVGCTACQSNENSSTGGVIDQANAAQENQPSQTGSDLPSITWKMVSTWGSGNVHYQCDLRFSELVSYLTGGKFKIQNYAEGELCSASQCFDYVEEGTVQAAGDCAAYWVGRNSAFELLNDTVDDFTGMDYFLWINEAGGLECFQELYGQFNMTYFPICCSWSESGLRSSVPITSLKDLQNLKIRMGSVLPGKALQKLGVSTVSVSGSELYESMQRGVIDACEFSNPYADDSLKLQEVAKYWCVPCWFQSAGILGVMINKDAWNALPEEYQEAVEMAAYMTQAEKMAEYFWNDAATATKMIEQEGVTVTSMDDESMEKVLAAYREVLAEEAKANPDVEMIMNSMAAYREKVDMYRGMLGKYGFGFVKEQ